MLVKEFTYVIVGLIIMLAINIKEAIKDESFRMNYENVSKLVGGVVSFSVSVMLWPMVVVNKILIKL